MTEPDDRPGSDDPEDPSELMRLIGRTVPRSPHASTSDEPTAGDDSGSGPEPGPQYGSGPPEPESESESEPESPAPESETPAPEPWSVPRPAFEPEPEDEPGPASNGRVPAEPADESEDPDTEDPDTEDPDAGDPDAPDREALADDTELELALEALLLVVDSPIDEASLATALDQPAGRIRRTLNRMSLAYTADRRGIDLRRAGEGWRFYTRDRYAPYVEKLLLDGQRARLTRAALETLAVVAYRQPVTRARVSAVRGVNCDGVLRTLLTRGLVEEAGTEEQTGGTLFRTTELFLERLGLSSVQELPPLAPLLPDIDAIDDLES